MTVSAQAFCRPAKSELFNALEVIHVRNVCHSHGYKNRNHCKELMKFNRTELLVSFAYSSESNKIAFNFSD